MDSTKPECVAGGALGLWQDHWSAWEWDTCCCEVEPIAWSSPCGDGQGSTEAVQHWTHRLFPNVFDFEFSIESNSGDSIAIWRVSRSRSKALECSIYTWSTTGQQLNMFFKKIFETNWIEFLKNFKLLVFRMRSRSRSNLPQLHHHICCNNRIQHSKAWAPNVFEWLWSISNIELNRIESSSG